MFVVDSWLLQDGNESEEKFLKSLREECITNVFAADRSTEKKKKSFVKHRCCSVTMQNFFYAIRQRSI